MYSIDDVNETMIIPTKCELCGETCMDPDHPIRCKKLYKIHDILHDSICNVVASSMKSKYNVTKGPTEF